MVKEGELLAVFNSVHRVMKAETLLKMRNIPFLLIPAPRALQTECGLALRFSPEDALQIITSLDYEGVMPEFIASYNSGDYVTVWHEPEPFSSSLFYAAVNEESRLCFNPGKGE